MEQIYVPTLKANYMVWPLVQVLNFRVVPLQFQLVSSYVFGGEKGEGMRMELMGMCGIAVCIDGGHLLDLLHFVDQFFDKGMMGCLMDPRRHKGSGEEGEGYPYRRHQVPPLQGVGEMEAT